MGAFGDLVASGLFSEAPLPTLLGNLEEAFPGVAVFLLATFVGALVADLGLEVGVVVFADAKRPGFEMRGGDFLEAVDFTVEAVDGALPPLTVAGPLEALGELVVVLEERVTPETRVVPPEAPRVVPPEAPRVLAI